MKTIVGKVVVLGHQGIFNFPLLYYVIEIFAFIAKIYFINL